MLSALVLAAVASMPLGVWPEASGPPVVVVDDVEIYVDEPQDDFFILAVQAVDPPFARDDADAVRRLATVARKLGADGVLLLGELPVAKIPDDVNAPLVPTKRYAVAVYLSFDATPAPEGGQVRRGSTPRVRAAPTFLRAGGGTQPRSRAATR